MMFYRIKETNIYWTLNQSKAPPYMALENQYDHQHELKQGSGVWRAKPSQFLLAKLSHHWSLTDTSPTSQPTILYIMEITVCHGGNCAFSSPLIFLYLRGKAFPSLRLDFVH